RMRCIPLILIAVLGTTVATSVAAGQEPRRTPTTALAPGWPLSEILGPRDRFQSNDDVTVLGLWTFEDGMGGPDAQGWTTYDRSSQLGTFFHVEDFNPAIPGMGPLAGTKSLWCGARACPAVPEVCDYLTLPGYGNSWDQRFSSVALSVTGHVTLTFLLGFDLEPSYDFIDLQYRSLTSTWQTLDSFTGLDYAPFEYSVLSSEHNGTVEFRFRVRSDAVYSDEDGGYNSLGAAVIDDILVEDATGIVSYQQFEAEAEGALTTLDGEWFASPVPAKGDYAELINGGSVLQEDPNVVNPSHVWSFFKNSPDDYTCGGHPGQAVVPFGSDGSFIRNEIQSPVISLAPLAQPVTSLTLAFDVYRYLPLDNLVTYEYRVRSRVGGQWNDWRASGINYYGPTAQWHVSAFEIAPLIDGGATDIQVAIGVRDLCGIWCGSVGSGACHTNAPLIDNVRVANFIANTPAGFDVVVTPEDVVTGTTPVTLTFNYIDQPGATTLTTGSLGPAVTGLFTLANGTYYDVSTSATFLGNVEICIAYDEGTLTVPEADLRLLHWDTELNPDAWVDITTSLEIIGNTICGVTDHFSPFALVAPVPTAVGDAPVVLALHQNVPNPFNPNTTIAYDVPAGGAHVSIEIYDVTGRAVRTLVDGPRPAGTHRVDWDGRNASGTPVASGVYLYRMTSGTFVETRRMVLLK
ncbi:MAG TPA: FlgD immunoglobulin-like domain containing protein, partial [Candidatus Krumholzibacteria bacterium]|nr:FlgD immunoglobulin-like domain containing protein [Candidatus Krumholzibacteria bacterium]